MPPPATEPPAPEDIASADELFITGLHLDQYRHATRSPAAYWGEALRRDPLDARCNNALGLRHLKRGEFADAEEPLPAGDPAPDPPQRQSLRWRTLLQSGLALRYLGRDDEAYDAFYKATWNQAWVAAGYHALAEIDGCRGDWAAALEHLDRSLRFDTDNLRAREPQGRSRCADSGRDAEAADLLAGHPGARSARLVGPPT